MLLAKVKQTMNSQQTIASQDTHALMVIDMTQIAQGTHHGLVQRAVLLTLQVVVMQIALGKQMEKKMKTDALVTLCVMVV
jgi:trimethylamine:corrinoid methyltransferase-like protein